MQTESPKDPVKHVGNPRQVSRIFENRNGEKHEQHERNKSDDPSHPSQ